jgi:DNA polymerase III gamma/tau subunit
VHFLALPQEQQQQQQPQQEQPQQQLQQQEEIQEATWLEEMLNTMQTQLRSLNQPTLQQRQNLEQLQQQCLQLVIQEFLQQRHQGQQLARIQEQCRQQLARIQERYRQQLADMHQVPRNPRAAANHPAAPRAAANHPYAAPRAAANRHAGLVPAAANPDAPAAPAAPRRHTLRGVRWCNHCCVFRDRDVNAAQNILAIYAAREQRPLYLTRGENVNEGRLRYQTVRPFRQGKRSQAARPV